MKRINLLIAIAALAIVGFGFGMKGGDVQEGLEVGNKAPELKFQNPDGKAISLRETNKKRIVLLDFWASWCGPCRRENPYVVKAYTEFKDKKFKKAPAGFTIYSVSLDANMDAWKQAIVQDGLSWEYHVSDLGGWRSQPAALYGITSIPSNYLLDANGVIVAKNLRGPALEEALKQLLEK